MISTTVFFTILFPWMLVSAIVLDVAWPRPHHGAASGP